MGKYNLYQTKEDYQVLYDKIRQIEQKTREKYDWKKIKRSSYDQLDNLIAILQRRHKLNESMKYTKLRKTISSIVNEQTIKRPQIDLSTKEKSLTNWLQNHFDEINKKKIYQDPEKLIDYIYSAKNDGVHVSQQFLEKTADTIKKLKFPNRILQYLYNMYLNGSAMGLSENKKRKK